LLNLTKQEKSVLLFIGITAVAGISINYLLKHNPRLKNYFSDIASHAHHSSPVNINKADLQELTRLSGIGPVLAQRIIDYRGARGGFKSIDELKEVKGIGDSKFELLKDEITIE
jgi:comEA protein